jgi:hypothetical protein
MEAIIEQMCKGLVGKVLRGEVRCEVLADNSSWNSVSGTINRTIGVVLNADLVVRVTKYKISNRFGDYPGERPPSGEAAVYFASLASSGGKVLFASDRRSPVAEALYKTAELAMCPDDSAEKKVFTALATAYTICCS